MLSPSLRVLFVTSECTPFSKTGGLADVSAALPAALRAEGVDVRVLVPAYGDAAAQTSRTIATLPADGNFPRAMLVDAKLPSAVPALLLVCPELYARNGGPYQNSDGADWPDNAVRFGLLSRVAALAAVGAIPGWTPDVIHCNDWQAGLVPAYLRSMPAAHAATVFTIHNLAFQGIFPAPAVATLGLPADSFTVEGLEYYDQLSFLKGGIAYADAITTVSPTYAQEIQSEAYGCGLHGLLQRRRAHLSGILNGIDTALWNPARDAYLARNYDPSRLGYKVHNKRAVQLRAGLPPVDDPLLAAVTRLTGQKGIDWIIEIAPALAARSLQLIVLGRGEPHFERDLAALAAAYPENIAVALEFDERYAHLIEAGADIFLMPSRFEPCGMNQMYSQRYGTVPVVRATGGLADSVQDAARPDGTGFTYTENSGAALLAAIERATTIFGDRKAWRRLQLNGMRREFGWQASAARYLEIYRRVTAAKQEFTPSA
jgi:starch synthase